MYWLIYLLNAIAGNARLTAEPQQRKKQNAIAHSDQRVFKERRGDYRGAIADYNRAIALDPGDAVSYYNRGNAWF